MARLSVASEVGPGWVLESTRLSATPGANLKVNDAGGNSANDYTEMQLTWDFFIKDFCIKDYGETPLKIWSQ